jgi:hypothetical protein
MPFSVVMYTPAARVQALAMLAEPHSSNGYGLTFHFNQTHAGQYVTVVRVSAFEIPPEAVWQQFAPGVWTLGETSGAAMPIEDARAAEKWAHKCLGAFLGAKEQTAVPFAPC